MTGSTKLRLLALLTTLCLLAAACGSAAQITETRTEVDSPEATEVDDPETTETTATEAVNLVAINEQNLDEARRVLDAAKARWEAYEPFAYTFSAGFDTVNLVEIDFDAEGNAGPERVLLGEDDPTSLDVIPRSIDEAFDDVEELLAPFESGEFEASDPNECGRHFRALFDAEFGYPSYYHTLGPCDDGVGLSVNITPTDGTAGNTSQECDRSAFIGVWNTPYSNEPIPPEGAADEGGSGVLSLDLVDEGESFLQEADSIMIIEEWFCTSTALIALSQGEENELATINSDGTLSIGNFVLTKTASTPVPETEPEPTDPPEEPETTTSAPTTAVPPEEPERVIDVTYEIPEILADESFIVRAAGIRVVGQETRYSVAMLDSEAGVSQDTCEDALALAEEYAASNGLESSGECVAREQDVTERLEEIRVSDDSGATSIAILNDPEIVYQIIVSLDTEDEQSGCGALGVATLEPEQTRVDFTIQGQYLCDGD